MKEWLKHKFVALTCLGFDLAIIEEHMDSMYLKETVALAIIKNTVDNKISVNFFIYK